MFFAVEGFSVWKKVVHFFLLGLFSQLGVAAVLSSPVDHLPDPFSVHTILRMLASLALIICLLLILRFFLTKRSHFSSLLKTPHMRIVGSLSLSIKNRIVILEIADSWIIVGITAEKMNTLYTMPKPNHPTHAPTQTTPLHSASSFPKWLKSMVDRKNSP